MKKKIYKVKFIWNGIPELGGNHVVYLMAESIIGDLFTEFREYCKKENFFRMNGEFTIIPEMTSIKLVTKISNAK